MKAQYKIIQIKIFLMEKIHWNFRQQNGFRENVDCLFVEEFTLLILASNQLSAKEMLSKRNAETKMAYFIAAFQRKPIC